MIKCSICKENVAVIFMTKMTDGIKEPFGICMPCAQKQGLAPLDQLISQTGMNTQDFENLNNQMAEMFGSINMDEFINSMPENDKAIEAQNETPPAQDERNSSFMRFLNNALSGMNPNRPIGEASSETNDPTKPKEAGSSTTLHPERPEKTGSKARKNLNAFGTNLNEKALDGRIDRVIGREKEIERVIQILNRRNKNNPVLLGEPGVGKTAIAEGLAMRIIEGKIPSKLANIEIFMLDLAAIVAGTQFRGQFEARMKAIIDEAKAAGNVVLVIDEVHNIVGAGEAEGGAMNAANILKPALARGDVQIIGATTLEDYRKHIEKDSALERRFQPVMVNEPSVDEAIEIVKGVRKYYEDHHEVRFTDDVIEAAVRMSSRYIHDRFLPDKAIDVIDEAGSRVNLKNHAHEELAALRLEYKQLEQDMEAAAAREDYAKAADFKTEECRLSDKIQKLESEIGTLDVTMEDIASVVEGWTGIPVQRVNEAEAGKLLKLEERLHGRVIGQDRAVKALARAIRRTRTDLRRRKRPTSFIFVGPTGVGKTELAKALSVELFGSEEALIRLDMSEFMEKHTVSKLIGAPPGYIGFDQGGQLTEKVRRKPYSVLLLDEIEKAHPDVFNMLLQVMEDGRLTDSNGRTVGFENTLLIMTSNAGTSIRTNSIGFNKDSYEALEKRVTDAIRDVFRPEFLNRVDETVVFEELSKEQLREIVDLMLREVTSDLLSKHIHISFDDASREFLLARGYDPKFGARPLRKTIQRHVEDELSEMYLKGDLFDGSSVAVGVEGEHLCFLVAAVPVVVGVTE